ncbi:MAG: hypothetical protein WCT15_00300, partial [Candidatus Omnitrophota bacterium]
AGNATIHTYEYRRDPDTATTDLDGGAVPGDVLVDEYGNPEYIKETWRSYEKEHITETEFNAYYMQHTLEYQYGKLFSRFEVREDDLNPDGSVKAGVFSKWVKSDSGEWALKIAYKAEDLDEPDLFALTVNAETGGIELVYDSDGRRIDQTMTPGQFGNYDFFAQKLTSGDYMVYINKGGKDTAYAGMTLKYHIDENGVISNLIEFNDRVADLVKLYNEEEAANNPWLNKENYVNDPAAGITLKFKRAPTSSKELTYLQEREMLDYELEGGELEYNDGTKVINLQKGATDGGTAPPLEVVMERVQQAMLDMNKSIEEARNERETAWATAVRELTTGALAQKLAIPERGKKVITYDWGFNTVYPELHRTDDTIGYNWEKINLRYLGLMCATGGGIMGAMTGVGIYNDTNNLPDFQASSEIVYPRFTWWLKRRTVDVNVAADASLISLEEFKKWVVDIKNYVGDNLVEDVADYLNYLQNREIFTDAQGNALVDIDGKPLQFKKNTDGSFVLDSDGEKIPRIDYDENGNPYTRKWVDIYRESTGTIKQEDFTIDGFMKWMAEEERSGALLLGDVATMLTGGQMQERDKVGVRVYDGDGNPVMDTIRGYYEGDTAVIDWIREIIGTEKPDGTTDYSQGMIGSAARTINEAYFKFEETKNKAIDTFIYEPATAANQSREIRSIFTADVYDEVIPGAYGITTDVANKSNITSFLERARAIYRYVIEMKRSESFLEFSNNVSAAQSRMISVTGYDDSKVKEDTPAEYKTKLTGSPTLKQDKELYDLVNGVSTAGLADIAAYTAKLREACTTMSLRLRLESYLKDTVTTPSWIPGSYAYEAVDPTPDPVESARVAEAKAQLKKWLVSKGRMTADMIIGEGGYIPGSMDYYEWEIDKTMWALRDARADLADSVRLKELALDGVFDFEYAVPDIIVYPTGTTKNTYLSDYIADFWEKGGRETVSSLTGAERIEATLVDRLTMDVLDVLESLLEANTGEQFYEKPELEHLLEYSSQMEVLEQALKAFDSRDNVKVWEGENLEWQDYIDSSSTLAFYTDYGQQKAHLAAYAMYQYVKLAQGAIQKLQDLRKDADIANMVTSLMNEITSYTPTYTLTETEKLRREEDYTADPPRTPFIDMPYHTTAGGERVYDYESLAAWKAAVLSKLNKYGDTNQRKDPTYSLPETIKEAAKLTAQLAKENARMENEAEVSKCNNLFTEFDQNAYRKAKAEVLSFTDKTEWVMKTEVVTLTSVEGSGSLVKDINGNPVHYVLKKYYDLAKLSNEYSTVPEDEAHVISREISDGINTYRVDVADDGITLNVYVKHGESAGTPIYDKYKVSGPLAANLLKEGEDKIQGEVTTFVGKLFDSKYMNENYGVAEETERDTFDFEEEQVYRKYAAKVGMGGARLAQLYADIETLYAQRLVENAQSYLSGIVSEEEYEANILDIKYRRQAHREAIELYLLGATQQFDISELASVKDDPDARNRLYGILKDITNYMSEEEKRAFVKGEKLTQLTQQYDSVFDLMIERYDGVIFDRKYMNNTEASITAVLTAHKSAVGTFLEKFSDDEVKVWNEYKDAAEQELKDYREKLTYFVDQMGSSQTKIKNFFSLYSWVPAGNEYVEFRRTATPGVDAVDTLAQDLGEVVFEKISQFMEGLGKGMHSRWIYYNQYYVTQMNAEIVRQNRLDEYFYDYSNAMEAIIQHLTAFTDKAGLTYETKKGETYRNWWAINGYKYHMDNYAYSNDEKLRNAYMGYQIINALTETAFNTKDTDLELDAQKIISASLGVDVGSYQYKEYGNEQTKVNAATSELYGLTVVGQNRYRDYKGTYDKKVKGELGDKYFLHGDTTVSETLTEKPDVAAGSGKVVAKYNATVKAAVDTLSSAIRSKIPEVTNYQLLDEDDGTPISTSYRGDVLETDNIDYDKLDLITTLSTPLKVFSDAVYAAQNTLSKDLDDLVSYRKDSGAKSQLVRSSLAGQEVTTTKLWNDMFHLVNVQTEFFATAVKTARDYIEEGLPGSSWSDTISGKADGRRNLHIYAMHQFAEYYTPDTLKFTNDKTYNVLERAGLNYMKTLGTHVAKGKNGLATTVNEAFLDYASFERDLPYEVSDLTSGITEQYIRNKKGEILATKTFGAGKGAYDLNVISDIYSGAYVYSKYVDEENDGTISLFTDRQGARGINGEYVEADLTVRNMRERQEYSSLPFEIRSWDDYKIATLTRFAKFYDQEKSGWKRLIYSRDDREGYFMNRVYDVGGLSRANARKIYDAVDRNEKDIAMAMGVKAEDIGEHMVKAITGVFGGISAVFGMVSLKKKSLTGTIGFGITPLATKLFDLRRENAVSRLKRAMAMTGSDSAAGRIKGIDVSFARAEGEDYGGTYYAVTPGKVSDDDYKRFGYAIDYLTGADNTIVTTLKGVIWILRAVVMKNKSGGEAIIFGWQSPNFMINGGLLPQLMLDGDGSDESIKEGQERFNTETEKLANYDIKNLFSEEISANGEVTKHGSDQDRNEVTNIAYRLYNNPDGYYNMIVVPDAAMIDGTACDRVVGMVNATRKVHYKQGEYRMDESGKMVQVTEKDGVTVDEKIGLKRVDGYNVSALLNRGYSDNQLLALYNGLSVASSSRGNMLTMSGTNTADTINVSMFYEDAKHNSYSIARKDANGFTTTIFAMADTVRDNESGSLTSWSTSGYKVTDKNGKEIAYSSRNEVTTEMNLPDSGKRVVTHDSYTKDLADDGNYIERGTSTWNSEGKLYYDADINRSMNGSGKLIKDFAGEARLDIRAELFKKEKSMLSSAGSGAAFGATIGMAFGPVGFIIGLVVGAIVGAIWNKVSSYIETKLIEKGMSMAGAEGNVGVCALGGAAAGAAIGVWFFGVGALVGAVIGGLIGAAIGVALTAVQYATSNGHAGKNDNTSWGYQYTGGHAAMNWLAQKSIDSTFYKAIFEVANFFSICLSFVPGFEMHKDSWFAKHPVVTAVVKFVAIIVALLLFKKLMVGRMAMFGESAVMSFARAGISTGITFAMMNETGRLLNDTGVYAVAEKYMKEQPNGWFFGLARGFLATVGILFGRGERSVTEAFALGFVAGVALKGLDFALRGLGIGGGRMFETYTGSIIKKFTDINATGLGRVLGNYAAKLTAAHPLWAKFMSSIAGRFASKLSVIGVNLLHSMATGPLFFAAFGIAGSAITFVNTMINPLNPYSFWHIGFANSFKIAAATFLINVLLDDQAKAGGGEAVAVLIKEGSETSSSSGGDGQSADTIADSILQGKSIWSVVSAYKDKNNLYYGKALIDTLTGGIVGGPFLHALQLPSNLFAGSTGFLGKGLNAIFEAITKGPVRGSADLLGNMLNRSSWVTNKMPNILNALKWIEMRGGPQATGSIIGSLFQIFSNPINTIDTLILFDLVNEYVTPRVGSMLQYAADRGWISLPKDSAIAKQVLNVAASNFAMALVPGKAAATDRELIQEIAKEQGKSLTDIRASLTELRTSEDVARVMGVSDAALGSTGRPKGAYVKELTSSIKEVAVAFAQRKVVETMMLKGAYRVNESAADAVLKGSEICSAKAFAGVDFTAGSFKGVATDMIYKALNPAGDLRTAVGIAENIKNNDLQVEIDGSKIKITATDGIGVHNDRTIATTMKRSDLNSMVESDQLIRASEVSISGKNVRLSDTLKESVLARWVNNRSTVDVIAAFVKSPTRFSDPTWQKVAIQQMAMGKQRLSAESIRSLFNAQAKTSTGAVDTKSDVMIGETSLLEVVLVRAVHGDKASTANYAKERSVAIAADHRARAPANESPDVTNTRIAFDQATIYSDLNVRMPKGLQRQVASEIKADGTRSDFGKFKDMVVNLMKAEHAKTSLVVRAIESMSSMATALIDRYKKNDRLTPAQLALRLWIQSEGKINQAEQRLTSFRQVVDQVGKQGIEAFRNNSGEYRIKLSASAYAGDATARANWQTKIDKANLVLDVFRGNKKFAANESQIKTLIDMLTRPDGIFEMLTGMGKTSAISPLLTVMVRIFYSETFKIMSNISINEFRLGQAWQEFVKAFDGSGGTVSKPIEIATGIEERTITFVDAKTGKEVLTITAVKVTPEAIPTSTEARAAMLKTLNDSKFDVIFTDINTLKSLKMEAEGGVNNRLAQAIMNRVTDKSWALYDEAHVLPVSADLIVGGDGKHLKADQVKALETVHRFLEQLYKAELKNAPNLTQREFFKGQDFRSKYMMAQNTTGTIYKFNGTFYKEFFNWAKQNGVESVQRFRSVDSFRSSRDVINSALNGFSDALNIVQGGKEGYSYSYLKDSDRVVPVQNDMPAPNMRWSEWNKAGARDLMARMFEGKFDKSAEFYLNKVETNPDSKRVTDLSVLKEFTVRTLMTGTTNLLTWYGTLQGIMNMKGTGPKEFGRLSQGRMNELTYGTIFKGTWQRLVEQKLSAVNKLLVFGQEANIDRQVLVEAVVNSASVKGLDVWVQTGNEMTFYRDGKERLTLKIEKEKAGDVEFNEVLHDAMRIADINGGSYKGIILLDRTGVTGLNLERGVYIKESVKVHATKLLEAFGGDRTIFAPHRFATLKEEAAQRKIALGDHYDSYSEYLNNSVEYIGMFDKTSLKSLVEQTVGRDRGIGGIEGDNAKFGYHKKEIWMVDETSGKDVSKMTIQDFENNVFRNEIEVLKVSLVKSVSDSMHEAIIDRFRTMSERAMTGEERTFVDTLRTKFQSSSKVSDMLMSAKVEELPTLKNAIESDITRQLSDFRNMVKGDVSSLGKQNREFLRSVMRLDKTFFSGDRVVLKFEGDKLTPKDGAWSLKKGVQVDKAFAKLSVLGIIKEAEAFFPRAMMETETVNFGTGRGAEPVKRMQGAIAEIAPKSTSAVQDIVAKMQNYDIGRSSGAGLGKATIEWSQFVLGCMAESYSPSAGLDADKRNKIGRTMIAVQDMMNFVAATGNMPTLDQLRMIAGNDNEVMKGLLVASTPRVGIREANRLINLSSAMQELKASAKIRSDVTLSLDNVMDYIKSPNSSDPNVSSVRDNLPPSINKIVSSRQAAADYSKNSLENAGKAQVFGGIIEKLITATIVKLSENRVLRSENVTITKIRELARSLGVSESAVIALVENAAVSPEKLQEAITEVNKAGKGADRVTVTEIVKAAATDKPAEAIAVFIGSGPEGHMPTRLADTLAAQGTITKDSHEYKFMQKLELGQKLGALTGLTPQKLAEAGLISGDVAKALEGKAPSIRASIMMRLQNFMARDWYYTRSIAKAIVPLTAGVAIAVAAPYIGVTLGTLSAAGIVVSLYMPLLKSLTGKLTEQAAGEEGSALKKIGAGTTGLMTHPIFTAISTGTIIGNAKLNEILTALGAGTAMTTFAAVGLGVVSMFATIGIRRLLSNRDRTAAAALWKDASLSGSADLAMDDVMKMIGENNQTGIDTKISDIKAVIDQKNAKLGSAIELGAVLERLADAPVAKNMARVYAAIPDSMKEMVGFRMLSSAVAKNPANINMAVAMVRADLAAAQLAQLPQITWADVEKAESDYGTSKTEILSQFRLDTRTVTSMQRIADTLLARVDRVNIGMVKGDMSLDIMASLAQSATDDIAIAEAALNLGAASAIRHLTEDARLPALKLETEAAKFGTTTAVICKQLLSINTPEDQAQGLAVVNFGRIAAVIASLPASVKGQLNMLSIQNMNGTITAPVMQNDEVTGYADLITGEVVELKTSFIDHVRNDISIVQPLREAVVSLVETDRLTLHQANSIARGVGILAMIPASSTYQRPDVFSMNSGAQIIKALLAVLTAPDIQNSTLLSQNDTANIISAIPALVKANVLTASEAKEVFVSRDGTGIYHHLGIGGKMALIQNADAIFSRDEAGKIVNNIFGTWLGQKNDVAITKAFPTLNASQILRLPSALLQEIQVPLTEKQTAELGAYDKPMTDQEKQAAVILISRVSDTQLFSLRNFAAGITNADVDNSVLPDAEKAVTVKQLEKAGTIVTQCADIDTGFANAGLKHTLIPQQFQFIIARAAALTQSDKSMDLKDAIIATAKLAAVSLINATIKNELMKFGVRSDTDDEVASAVVAAAKENIIRNGGKADQAPTTDDIKEVAGAIGAGFIEKDIIYEMTAPRFTSIAARAAGMLKADAGLKFKDALVNAAKTEAGVMVRDIVAEGLGLTEAPDNETIDIVVAAAANIAAAKGAGNIPSTNDIKDVAASVRAGFREVGVAYQPAASQLRAIVSKATSVGVIRAAARIEAIAIVRDAIKEGANLSGMPDNDSFKAIVDIATAKAREAAAAARDAEIMPTIADIKTAARTNSQIIRVMAPVQMTWAHNELTQEQVNKLAVDALIGMGFSEADLMPAGVPVNVVLGEEDWAGIHCAVRTVSGAPISLVLKKVEAPRRDEVKAKLIAADIKGSVINRLVESGDVMKYTWKEEPNGEIYIIQARGGQTVSSRLDALVKAGEMGQAIKVMVEVADHLINLRALDAGYVRNPASRTIFDDMGYVHETPVDGDRLANFDFLNLGDLSVPGVIKGAPRSPEQLQSIIAATVEELKTLGFKDDIRDVLATALKASMERAQTARDISETMKKRGIDVSNELTAAAIKDVADKVWMANNGVLKKGQKVTIKIGEDNIYNIAADRDGISLLDAALKQAADAGDSKLRSYVEKAISDFKFNGVLPYEVAFAILPDGTIKYSSLAEIVFDEDGKLRYMACTESVNKNDVVIFRGHTHPHVAVDPREFNADQKNLDEGVFGAVKELLIIQGQQAIMTVLPRTTPAMMLMAAAPAAAAQPVLDITYTFTRGADGLFKETMTMSEALPPVAPKKAEAKEPEKREAEVPDKVVRRDAEEPGLFKDRQESEAYTAAFRSLLVSDKMSKELLDGIKAIRAQKNLTTLQIADGIAQLLKQAGIFTNNIGIGIDARGGGYDADFIVDAIKEVAGENSPVRYCVIVGSDLEKAHIENRYSDLVARRLLNAVVVARGENAFEKAADAMRDLDVKDNYSIALAITESDSNVAMVKEHYEQRKDDPKTRLNFMIANSKVVQGVRRDHKEGDVVAGAILTEMVKLASQDKTTVLAIACGQNTIKTL